MFTRKLSYGRCYMRSRDNEEVRDGAGLAIVESDQILILHGENRTGKRQKLSHTFTHSAYICAETENKIMYLIDNIETFLSGNVTEDT